MLEIKRILNSFSPETRLQARLQSHLGQERIDDILADLENPVFEKIPEKERSEIELKALTACLDCIRQQFAADNPLIESSSTVFIRSAKLFVQVAQNPPLTDENAKKRRELFEKAFDLVTLIPHFFLDKIRLHSREFYNSQIKLEKSCNHFTHHKYPLCSIPTVKDLIGDRLREAIDSLAIINAKILVRNGPIVLSSSGHLITNEKQKFFLMIRKKRRQFLELSPLVPGVDLDDLYNKTGLSAPKVIDQLRKHRDKLFPLVSHFEIAKISAFHSLYYQLALEELISGITQQKEIIEKIAGGRNKNDPAKQSLVFTMTEVALDSMILAIRICGYSVKNGSLNSDGVYVISQKIKEIAEILEQHPQIKLQSSPNEFESCYKKSAAAYALIGALTPNQIFDSSRQNLLKMGLTLAADLGLNQQNVFDFINDYEQGFGLTLSFPSPPISRRQPAQSKTIPPRSEIQTGSKIPQKGDKILLTDGSLYKVKNVYQGGQSIVLKVENPFLRRNEVFRRKLNPDEQLLHIQTMKLVGQIRSELLKIDPNLALMIPIIYGIYTTEDKKQYISLEYIEGETIEDRIKKNGKFSEDEDEIRKVLQGLAQLLHYLHSQKGLIYRDLKPANVMIRSENGRAVLIDWDLLSPAGENIDQLGTITHTPPERIPIYKQSPSLVFPVSDTYALGIMTYEMLTGELQEEKNITGEVEERFPKIKQLSPFFQELIEQCTRTDFSIGHDGKQYPLRWNVTKVLTHLHSAKHDKDEPCQGVCRAGQV